MNNKQVQQHIQNIIIEVDKINSKTSWVYEGQLAWKIVDNNFNFLGIVNSSFNVETGDITLVYRYDKTTYSGVGKVKKIILHADMIPTGIAYSKLLEFDSCIIKAHNIQEAE